VARNVLPDEPEGERAEALANYLNAATMAIAAASLPEIRRGEIPFPPLASREGRGAMT
jgi:hypothetical protein